MTDDVSSDWRTLPPAARTVAMISGALIALPVAAALGFAVAVVFDAGAVAGIALFAAALLAIEIFHHQLATVGGPGKKVGKRADEAVVGEDDTGWPPPRSGCTSRSRFMVVLPPMNCPEITSCRTARMLASIPGIATGSTTVVGVRVPRGATCRLTGTKVEGNVNIARGANLVAVRLKTSEAEVSVAGTVRRRLEVIDRVDLVGRQPHVEVPPLAWLLAAGRLEPHGRQGAVRVADLVVDLRRA